jgi:hypothetical protein
MKFAFGRAAIQRIAWSVAGLPVCIGFFLVAQTGAYLTEDRLPEALSPERARPACRDRSSAEHYWVEGSFGEDDAFVRNWFASHLRAMAESSFSCGADPPGDTYRFLWLRTFHHPIAVRVALRGDAGSLVAVELDGQGGYDPGNVLRRIERRLTTGEATLLSTAIRTGRFWQIDTTHRPLGEMGLDGAEWILEGRRSDEYHVTHRWSPRYGPYREICLSILRLSGLRVQESEIY